jgi:hypothetical protein
LTFNDFTVEVSRCVGRGDLVEADATG